MNLLRLLVVQLLACMCGFAQTAPGLSLPSSFKVLDSRINASPGASCSSLHDVFYFGRTAYIRGNNIVSAKGVVAFHADEPILDTQWSGGRQYVLSRSQVRILGTDAKSNVTVKLPAPSQSGRLLMTTPGFLAFSSRSAEAGAVATLTARSLKVVDTEADFAGAAFDHFGNIVVATAHDVFAISHAGHRVPVLHVTEGDITDIAILPDDALLISTTRGLLKLAGNRHVYPLLSGTGALLQGTSGFGWCDGALGAGYALKGVDLPGTAASDKELARALLKQAHVYIQLGERAKAYQKVEKILQLTPNDKEMVKLADTLRRSLKTRQANSPA